MEADLTEIVIRVEDYGGKKGVTIREYLASEKYTGFDREAYAIRQLCCGRA